MAGPPVAAEGGVVRREREDEGSRNDLSVAAWVNDLHEELPVARLHDVLHRDLLEALARRSRRGEPKGTDQNNQSEDEPGGSHGTSIISQARKNYLPIRAVVTNVVSTVLIPAPASPPLTYGAIRLASAGLDQAPGNGEAG